MLIAYNKLIAKYEKLKNNNLQLNNNLTEYKEEVTQQNEELLLQNEDLIKQRKIIENNKATLEAIYNGVSDAIFLMNNKVFVDCNTATLELFDCERDEIIGFSPSEFSPEYQSNHKLSSELSQYYISEVYRVNLNLLNGYIKQSIKKNLLHK